MNATVTRRGDAVEVLAPAKINLRLEVRGKRGDGYHELWTVMMAVDLTDRLCIQPRAEKDFELACSDPDLMHNNLVSRAWEVFSGHTGIRDGVRIELRKSIPAGAGLGGGSSDAAAALIGLDALFGSDLGVETLSELGAGVGSDVPFFFAETSLAVCRGRGEVVEAIESSARPVGVLVMPPLACGTAAVYAEYDRGFASSPAGGSPRTPGAFAEAVDAWPAQMYNDLESAALRMEPRLREIRSSLEVLAPLALVMTGSGSGFYCLCRDSSQAERIREGVCSRGLGAARVVHRWRAAAEDTIGDG